MRGKQLHTHKRGSQSFATKRDIFVSQSNFLTQYIHVDTYTTNNIELFWSRNETLWHVTMFDIWITCLLSINESVGHASMVIYLAMYEMNCVC